MLKGHVFSEQLFGVDIFALFLNNFLGGHNGIIESYKNAMEMENTASSITIKEGVLVIQGRYIEEHTETIINYVNTEERFCKLVVEVDLSKINTQNALNQVCYKILENELDYPALIQNDIINRSGDVYQFELARFKTGLTGITDFEDTREFLSFDSVYSGIIQDNLNSDSSTSALAARQGKFLTNKIKGVTLYEGSAGSGTINLNDNLSNYDYISIEDSRKHIKYFNASANSIVFDVLTIPNENTFRHFCATLSFSSNTIEIENQYFFDSTGYNQAYEGLSFRKIIGYKR